ncbi:hypothetical protein [Flavobacterium sp. LC2016-01]|uniref:hypothetical protein n=1 Tax=Flavobacterium sp. LC2016-01 TaxID=2675876 RepID=UPI0012BA9ECC|nr:hypothetical protein [Flavobacterium sp. LC2016-01]MTH16247.1 hypothetical protein [Flavobacterium sp. LC2016-01]
MDKLDKISKIEKHLEKFTPSAEQALEETVLELYELIVNRANLIAQKGQTGDKEISLRDILEAKESLFKAKIEKDKADNRRKRLMTVISLTGALYSIVGVFIYVYQNQDFAIEKNLGLVIALTGIVTIFVGFTYTQLLLRKHEDKQQENVIKYSLNDEFDIIKRWQLIEKLGSNLMIKKGYTNNESKSINDILKFLASELKNESHNIEMRELLTIRNKILHEGYELGKHERQSYLEKADKIIEVLEGLENNS